MYQKIFQLLAVTLAAIAVTSPVTRADSAPATSQPAVDAPRPARRPADPGSLFTGPGRMEPIPDSLKNVAIDEKLNAKLPLDGTFTNESGQTVRIGDYFTAGRPVILQLGYYGCPMLCDLVSQGTVNSLRNVPLEVGKDFDLVFISIDPAEGHEMAYKKKNAFLRAYGRGGPDGWHFLVGRELPIRELAQAVGFNYKWVATAGQFSHPAAIILITPEGKVSRYMYGVKFESDQLLAAINDAAQKKTGESADKYTLTCLQYDGKQGKLAGTALWMVRIGGILTVIILGSVLWRLFAKERAKAAAARSDSGGTPPFAGPLVPKT